jgi:sialic acid synthase SpsE
MSGTIKIQDQLIGEQHPTYFIADIAANHDGDFEKAKDLIHAAAESGADAVKFQHFLAEKIVSDYGFKDLRMQQSHQAKWKKTVFEVYEDASLPRDWTKKLQEISHNSGVHFFSAPYDFEAVDILDNIDVPAHKIGSGDITWIAMLNKIAKAGKPVLIATGASDLNDVSRAMDTLIEADVPICLMQCNTNYTGSLENFRYINLNVLKTYKRIWPNIVLGLSDHTPGHSTVLGAVTLGARAIEKHFTLDKKEVGPDHAFSMDPNDWREMVDRTRELQLSLGSDQKFIVENELETVVLQRRCIRASDNIAVGTVLDSSKIEVLRPAPQDSIPPHEINLILGKVLKQEKKKGQHFLLSDFE